jgi:hypothetical protein
VRDVRRAMHGLQLLGIYSVPVFTSLGSGSMVPYILTAFSISISRITE